MISYFSSYFVDLGFVITWLFVLCAVFHCVRVIACLVSVILWSIGFGIFVFKYAPILLKARVDGAIG
ncbi:MULTISPECIES: hypothetical protein [unclassified Pseudoalteromonas]|uniref:hypothetical protein n=1 Tax=unclassified Pseudoalteromonas TaxID=194690 RepID=UPI0005AB892B|nr:MULTISPECIES: hypothetical protein [unclassified Pseudoalteromonas]